MLINKRLHIITTTAIKGVSDGGHVAIYLTSDSSIDCPLELHDPSKDDSLQIMQFFDDPVPVSQTSLSQVPHVQQFEPAQELHLQSNLSQCLYQLLLSHHPLLTS